MRATAVPLLRQQKQTRQPPRHPREGLQLDEQRGTSGSAAVYHFRDVKPFLEQWSPKNLVSASRGQASQLREDRFGLGGRRRNDARGRRWRMKKDPTRRRSTRTPSFAQLAGQSLLRRWQTRSVCRRGPAAMVISVGCSRAGSGTIATRCARARARRAAAPRATHVILSTATASPRHGSRRPAMPQTLAASAMTPSAKLSSKGAPCALASALPRSVAIPCG